MLKSNKGVTLVALVITIIVLLILAGVSISLVVGDNGVLTNATTAVDETALAQVEETLGLAISSAQADYLAAWVDDRSVDLDDYFNTEYFLDQGYISDEYENLDFGDTTSGSGSIDYKGITYTFDISSTDHAYVVSNVAVSED